MGDRANIYLVQQGGKSPGIYLYTHWSGYALPSILQNALKRGQGRWDDEQYLGRIIFSEMVKDHLLNDTGYGVTTYLCDRGYRILIVDSEHGTVGISASSDSIEPINKWTFDEFVALDLGADGWETLGGA